MNPPRLFDIPVLACDDWPTNGHLIEAVAQLGYLSPRSRVLDMTFGRGGWWTCWRPDELVAHDLHTLDGVDFRALPHVDGAFDVVCFDPPYVESRPDRSTMPRGRDFLNRYGMDTGPRNFAGMWEQLRKGLEEAARVVRPGGVVLVKCMAYQSGKRFRPVPAMVTVYAEGLGLDLADELTHRRNPGPGEWDSQNSSRRNTSTLLVLRRRRRRPRRGTTAATLSFAQLLQRAIASGPAAYAAAEEAV